MSFFKNLTIQKRFLLTTAIVVTFSAIITTSFLIYNEFTLLNLVYTDVSKLAKNMNSQQNVHLRKAETKQKKAATDALNVKAHSLLQFISKIAPTAMKSADYMLLDEYIAQLCKDPDIVLCYAKDNDNEIVSTYSNEANPVIKKLMDTHNVYGIPSVSKLLSKKSNIKELSNSIEKDGKKLGQIIIMVSNERLNKELNEMSSGYFVLKEGTKMTFKALQLRMKKQIKGASIKSLWIGGIAGLITIFAAVILTFFMVRGITETINLVVDNLKKSSDQVASSSSQVSSTSQELSDGASDQAASLEETSASLEEMSAMTKNNAGNANQANILMKDSNNVVLAANISVEELITSMEEIRKASEETSKIIKTIDEIAFQTNILALNAAVEAARAGEAGAGFAVVADEVRNLAMRAAEAAKNTEELIKATVEKIGDGTVIVEKSNNAFAQVTVNTKKLGELLDEISTASSEQADGIAQINKAISELDQGVQKNAINAKESALFSKEMNSLADQMIFSVEKLMVLVGKRETIEISSIKDLTNPLQKKRKFKKAPEQQGRTLIKPDEIIPLDDDFKDF
ncbi:MAG: hypothetical protein GY760_07130 [Deltaproteobacteria bacterium]|nr:hypothetical protein [Deltaproteobacteria bacterium]